MIECSDQFDLARQQHAVAENVTAHVADTGNGERIFLRVDALFVEVTLHRFPGAAGSDAHFLVVVAGRSAGRECVVKPEVVLGRDTVGNVGERRGPFIGSHDEIGVISVITHDALGRHDLVIDDIVRDIEETAHEGLVAVDTVF